MTKERTPEQEAVFQQFIAEATEVIIAMNRRISEQGNKETTFCASGCSTCCYQIFHVHPLEIEVICNRIASNPELRARFEEQNARRKARIEEQFEKVREISQIEDYMTFIREWIALKIPCALLYEGKCLVYEVRPDACSTYLSLSPPRVCAIDPKGYLSAPMAKLKDESVAAIGRLNVKYGIAGELLYDLSWHLDRVLNPPQEETKEDE